MEESLFPLTEAEEPMNPRKGEGKPRLKRADRAQVEWQPVALDSLVPVDHPVRLVWEWVQGLDLRSLYQAIQAVEGHAGQSAIDPRILLTLWLYATLEGVGSARALERLCEEHIAYRWICGGVGVNYHTLADFRVKHEEVLNQLLIESVAALQAEGLVSMKQVAQDGKKIRASAGRSSFHRHSSLEQHLEAARQQVETLRQEIAEDPAGTTRRQKAARERAVCERQERIEKAQKQLEVMQERAKKNNRKRDTEKERRASSTDPEARIMKMSDNGFRPAYNAQFSTDTASNIIVGVMVSQQGNDTNLASPMIEQIQQSHAICPEEILADGSYADNEEIVWLTQRGVTPYIPVPPKGKNKEPIYQPKPDDPPEVAAWRLRMASAEGKAIAKKRSAVAELVHAVLDQMNLDRMVVRGIHKVRTILLWFALAHNLMRIQLLRKKLALAVVSE